MKEKPLVHLLKLGEFRVWCRPSQVPAKLEVTVKPSKATCTNCLTAYRSRTQGRRTQFKVSHTGRDYNDHTQ